MLLDNVSAMIETFRVSDMPGLDPLDGLPI